MAWVTPACAAISVVVAPLNPFSANSISAALRMSCSLFSFFDIVFILTVLFNIAVNKAKIVLFLKQSKIFLKYFQKRCNSQKMAIFTL